MDTYSCKPYIVFKMVKITYFSHNYTIITVIIHLAILHTFSCNTKTVYINLKIHPVLHVYEILFFKLTKSTSHEDQSKQSYRSFEHSHISTYFAFLFFKKKKFSSNTMFYTYPIKTEQISVYIYNLMTMRNYR